MIVHPWMWYLRKNSSPPFNVNFTLPVQKGFDHILIPVPDEGVIGAVLVVGS